MRSPPVRMGIDVQPKPPAAPRRRGTGGRGRRAKRNEQPSPSLACGASSPIVGRWYPDRPDGTRRGPAGPGCWNRPRTVRSSHVPQTSQDRRPLRHRPRRSLVRRRWRRGVRHDAPSTVRPHERWRLTEPPSRSLRISTRDGEGHFRRLVSTRRPASAHRHSPARRRRESFRGALVRLGSSPIRGCGTLLLTHTLFTAIRPAPTAISAIQTVAMLDRRGGGRRDRVAAAG